MNQSKGRRGEGTNTGLADSREISAGRIKRALLALKRCGVRLATDRWGDLRETSDREGRRVDRMPVQASI